MSEAHEFPMGGRGEEEQFIGMMNGVVRKGDGMTEMFPHSNSPRGIEERESIAEDGCGNEGDESGKKRSKKRTSKK